MNILHSFELTYPQLPKSISRLSLLPLQVVSKTVPTLAQNIPMFHPKTNPLFSQNRSTLCPNQPSTKTNFPPNKRIELLNFMYAGSYYKHLSEPPQLRFGACSIQSHFCPKATPHFLATTPLFTQSHLRFASETFGWFKVCFGCGIKRHL